MENKSTIFLTVVAVATLLVMVAGATFAFFASVKDTNMNATADYNMPSKAASFTASADKNISITLNNFEQGAFSNGQNLYYTADEANLNVKLLAAEEGKDSVCKYDVIFTWTSEPQDYIEASNDSQSKYYIKTATISGKEFTIEAEATTKNADGEENVIFTAPEKNIDEFELFSKTLSNGKTEDYFVLVDDAMIASSSTTIETEVDWHVIARFYNINKDQAYLSGHNYSGIVTVDYSSINC